jgi:hypothetical protein
MATRLERLVWDKRTSLFQIFVDEKFNKKAFLSFIPDVAATASATASTPVDLSRSARREIYGFSGGRQQPDAKSLHRGRPGGQNGNVTGREGSGSKPESGKLRRTGFGRIKPVFYLRRRRK